MDVHPRSVRLAALLVALVLAGCASPAPSGPGTATLDILGKHGECHSFGGCAWVARLEMVDGTAEAEFQFSDTGPEMALGDGLPASLDDGTYRLVFEQRYLSDAIANDGARDVFLDATCALAFAVPGGRSALHVRVTFEPQRCTVSSAMEGVE